VTFLQKYPERRVLIEGHTDSVGSDAYNLDLSQRRADAVRDFLLQNGVNAAQISTRGYGKASPVASNATAEGRQQNRRVELIIS
jgi:outer membrane protein OmpA-like peptidoglycan-associated protein